eukprot:GFYU01000191.1.p1 GENE.GFYU01000191.1~~GFYU01000191.1.p1  ORF type:complete len:247 (+),score=83.77 GFYU01000191.1:194-934(+)
MSNPQSSKMSMTYHVQPLFINTNEPGDFMDVPTPCKAEAVLPTDLFPELQVMPSPITPHTTSMLLQLAAENADCDPTSGSSTDVHSDHQTDTYDNITETFDGEMIENEDDLLGDIQEEDEDELEEEEPVKEAPVTKRPKRTPRTPKSASDALEGVTKTKGAIAKPQRRRRKRSAATDEQELEKKKMKRMLRNRESAHLSRLRKKALMENLQEKVDALEEQVSSLMALNGALETENSTLKAQLQRLA